MRKLSKRIVAVLLVMAMTTSLLIGCSSQRDTVPSTNEIVTQVITPTVTPVTEIPTTNPTPTGSSVVQTGYTVYSHDAALKVSENWEDYIGSLDVFVYGLIANEFGDNFDVFPAEVTLPDGREICGVAYTDYTECYVYEEGKGGYVSSGFLSAVGDEGITQEEFDEGLVIDNLEIPDNTFSYLLAYRSEPFVEHCVVYNQYLVYGVNDEGCIFYENQQFQRDICDESLGALFSYDEDRFLYNPNGSEYVPLQGYTLSEQVDFQALAKEVNDILEEQNNNFVRVDIEASISIAHEAVISYLLSFQEETFLGYDVQELVSLAEGINARECFRITEEGLYVLTVEPTFREAASLMKWIVGSTTVIVTVVAGICSVVADECPPISAAFGAIAGTAAEIFMQVFVEKTDIRDINWDTVMLAAVTGAISGYLYSYVGSFEGITYSIEDTLIDATLGGVERTLRSKMNGNDWNTAIGQFESGFAIAFAVSAGIKVLSSALGKVTGKVGTGNSKAAQSGMISKIRSVSSNLIALKKVFNASPFHSEYLARKHLVGQISKSIKSLSGKLYDMNGNVITKSELEELAKKAQNGAQIGWVVKSEKRPICVWNKTVSTDLKEDSIDSVLIKMVNDRNKNFAGAADEFLKKYRNNPGSIPAEIKELLAAEGYEIGTISATDFVKMIQKSEYVLHECADMATVMIVKRAIHEEFRHSGGYSVAKAVEIQVAKIDFSQMCSIIALNGV